MIHCKQTGMKGLFQKLCQCECCAHDQPWPAGSHPLWHCGEPFRHPKNSRACPSPPARSQALTGVPRSCSHSVVTHREKWGPAPLKFSSIKSVMQSGNNTKLFRWHESWRYRPKPAKLISSVGAPCMLLQNTIKRVLFWVTRGLEGQKSFHFKRQQDTT